MAEFQSEILIKFLLVKNYIFSLTLMDFKTISCVPILKSVKTVKHKMALILL